MYKIHANVKSKKKKKAAQLHHPEVTIFNILEGTSL